MQRRAPTCAGVLAATLGGEFLPKLAEGDLVVNVIRLAGVDVDEAAANGRLERQLLAGFPDERCSGRSRRSSSAGS